MTRRDAYTLIEMMIALASAGVLMVGISSALYIAAQGMDLDQGASAARGRADAAVGRLLADARTATRFRSATATAVEFDVPDRTGDGAADTLLYAWSGTVGDPLTRTLNGGAAQTVLSDVRSLSFGAPSHAVATPNVTTTPLETWPVLGAGEAPSVVDPGVGITMNTPAGVVPGDLLIGVVATTGDEASLIATTGWTKLAEVNNPGYVSLTVWIRTVTTSESATHTWTWTNTESGIGWILPFYNQHASIPVAATEYATATGKSNTPVTPSVTAATNDSFVLRVGAFEKGAVDTTDVTGLPGHSDIWARNVSNILSAACGYVVPITAGATGTAAFGNKNSEEYAVMTIVITPRTPVGS